MKTNIEKIKKYYDKKISYIEYKILILNNNFKIVLGFMLMWLVLIIMTMFTYNQLVLTVMKMLIVIVSIAIFIVVIIAINNINSFNKQI